MASAMAQLQAAMATMDIVQNGYKVEPRTEYSTIGGVAGPLVILEKVCKHNRQSSISHAGADLSWIT